MTDQEPHSDTARAATAALLAALTASRPGMLRGTATRVQRGGKVYWYDSFRVGTDVRKAYLGEDSHELRATIWRARADRQAADETRPDRARLVRLLKAEGMPGVDNGTGSLLAALASVGAFEAGLTVIGNLAFRLYEGVLGVRLGFPPDLDRREPLTLALPAGPPEPLLASLADFSFDPAPAVRRPHSWRWRQTKGETLAGFVLATDDAEGRPRYIKPINVYAQTPRGIGWLIGDALEVPVPCRSGILVRVPRPERFAAHLTIRTGADQGSQATRNDHALLATLTRTLQAFNPAELAAAIADARADAAGWGRDQRTFDNTGTHM